MIANIYLVFLLGQFYGLNCVFYFPLPSSYVKVLTPVSPHVTVFKEPFKK